MSSIKETLKYKEYFNTTLFNNLESSSTRELDSSFLEYSLELNIIICTICKTSIKESNYSLKKHFRVKHSNYYKENIKNITRIVNSLITLNLSTIEDLRDIESNKLYYSNLSLDLNSIICLECLFISLNRDNIRKHFKAKHSLKENSTKKSNNYLEKISIQIIIGLDKRNTIYFISKLLIIELDRSKKGSKSINKEIDLESNTSNYSNRSNSSLSSNRDIIEESSSKSRDRVSTLDLTSLIDSYNI